MSRREWFVVIVLILLPINAWLGVFYYLYWQRQKAAQEFARQTDRQVQEFQARMVRRVQEQYGLREGQPLRYPFSYPVHRIGDLPPFGRGSPVLFINLSWIAAHEVWEPALKEALNASPDLPIVLLYRKPDHLDFKPITEMMHQLNNPRFSVLVGGDWMLTLFGSEGSDGALLILCDGNGVIRALERFPDLKVSRYWEEEVKDWRPKLHQAVKKFFGRV